MSEHLHSPPTIVVGIDGSRSAVDAALWAVDEADSRDIPLRLVYAIDPDAATGGGPQDCARDLAAAEIAVRYAFIAVESTDKPVKIEVEIVQKQPVRALREASRSAVMLCVGSTGFRHSQQGRIGSTAASVAATALCPVAVIRGHDPLQMTQSWIVAEVDEALADDGPLLHGLEEARLRGAPLRALLTWQSRYTDIHDDHAVSDGNRIAKAQLEHRLSMWKKRYPDLELRAATVHGTIANYLARYADSIQLLVVGHERAHGISELVGPPGSAALRDGRCSLLICESQTVL